MAEKSRQLAQEIGQEVLVSYALMMLGRVALTQGNYTEAKNAFQESAAILQTTGQAGQPDELAVALCQLSLTALGMGEYVQAQQQLADGLAIIQETRSWKSIVALAIAALFFIESGQKERGLELYALASTKSLVANSRWFADVVGRHVEAAAETLSPEVAAEARKRGEALDWWQTVEELLEQLRRPE